MSDSVLAQIRNGNLDELDEYYQKQLKSVAFGLMKFLAISNDKEELASIIHPNYDSWTWSEYLKEQSSKKLFLNTYTFASLRPCLQIMLLPVHLESLE